MKTRLMTAAAAALLVGTLATATPAFAEQSVGEKVDDAALLAKIKTNLLRSPEVEGLDVNVDVKDGVVTLSGTADTAAEKASAERIARVSDGVKKVDNRIAIKADAKPAAPPPANPPAPATAPPSAP